MRYPLYSEPVSIVFGSLSQSIDQNKLTRSTNWRIPFGADHKSWKATIKAKEGKTPTNPAGSVWFGWVWTSFWRAHSSCAICAALNPPRHIWGPKYIRNWTGRIAERDRDHSWVHQQNSFYSFLKEESVKLITINPFRDPKLVVRARLEFGHQTVETDTVCPESVNVDITWCIPDEVIVKKRQSIYHQSRNSLSRLHKWSRNVFPLVFSATPAHSSVFCLVDEFNIDLWQSFGQLKADDAAKVIRDEWQVEVHEI